MVTPNSSRKRSPRAPRDPLTLSASELEALIRESEQKIAVMEAFSDSPEWTMQRRRLDQRRKRLDNELRGLQRRLVRPIAGQPPVTLEQLAYQQGRLDENADLLRFPKLTLALWRDQIGQLHAIRARAT